MPIDVYMDFETLSTRPNATVLSLGILAVDRDTKYGITELLERTQHFKFSVKSQKVYKRHIDRGTIDWWKKQGKSAQRVVKPLETDIHIEDFPKLISNFLNEFNVNPKKSILWTRGIALDRTVMDDIYRDLDMVNPFPYWVDGDTRTAINMTLGITDGKIPAEVEGFEFTAHDASHDVIMDYLRIRRCYQIQKGKEFNSIEDLKLKRGEKI